MMGCIAPSDQRPGLWLSGEVAEFPSDWSFSDAHKEVALEIRAPYLLAHSVTIWCVSVEGNLYIAARDPDTKNWPGWVERENEVRLDVGGTLYEARLTRVDGEEVLAPVQRAYTMKYELPEPGDEGAPPMRYWRVGPRSAN